MSIHFKFKSAKEFDTVTFPGTVIRVLDLKKAIVDKKKLNKGLDFDLVITDAQSGKVYDDENTQLPRNTSVTVKRIPSQHPGSGLLARMKAEAALAAASPPVAPIALPSPVMTMNVPIPYVPLIVCVVLGRTETLTLVRPWCLLVPGVLDVWMRRVSAMSLPPAAGAASVRVCLDWRSVCFV
jgi:hypothetical protein